MSDADRVRWEQRYHTAKATSFQADPWLEEQLAPAPTGRLIDIACGRSGNLLMAARLGFDATGLDISAKALDDLAAEAKRQNLTLTTLAADLDDPDNPALAELQNTISSMVIWRYMPTTSQWQTLQRALVPGATIYFGTWTSPGMLCCSLDWMHAVDPKADLHIDPNLDHPNQNMKPAYLFDPTKILDILGPLDLVPRSFEILRPQPGLMLASIWRYQPD